MNTDKYLEFALNLHNAGEMSKAGTLYDIILSAVPDHADANHLSGLISLAKGDICEAVKRIHKAIEADPKQAIFYNSLGNAHKIEGNIYQAAKSYRKALSVDSDLYEAHHNLAKVLEKDDDITNAKLHLTMALKIVPGSYESNFSLARVLLKLEMFHEALEIFEKLIVIKPNDPDILNGFAFSLEKVDRLLDAIVYYENSLEHRPNDPSTLNNLGHALHAAGRADEAISYFKRCLEIEPENELAWDRYLFALIFSQDINRGTIYTENIRWASVVEKKINLSTNFNHKLLNRGKKIKLAYYAKDFSENVTILFFETLLKNHNLDLFEVHCYSDQMNQRNAIGHLTDGPYAWETISQLGPERAAEKMRGDGIDIFIGTTNFLASNRVISSCRPAPIIVSYMNQVSTTGLSCVDYLITDNRLSPIGSADDFFSEKLIRLSDFICYLPPNEPVVINPTPAIDNGFITFGCFNNLAKINKSVIETWSKILLSVPKSRLKLFSDRFRDKTICAWYYELFHSFGIHSSRVDFTFSILSRVDYLSQYNLIDIALDTYPFSGGTVTDETLYMGVPLVTLEGVHEMGLMSKSKLMSVNLSELIAQNIEDYITIAVELSQNLEKIKKIKSKLRADVQGTIFDGKKHILELENAYRKMWDDYCTLTE